MIAAGDRGETFKAVRQQKSLKTVLVRPRNQQIDIAVAL